jgi:hypothetical protein
MLDLKSRFSGLVFVHAGTVPASLMTARGKGSKTFPRRAMLALLSVYHTVGHFSTGKTDLEEFCFPEKERRVTTDAPL